MSLKLCLISIVMTLLSAQAFAEPYVAASLGWTFNQKLSGIKGDENLNYPDPSGGIFPEGALFTDTKYTNIKLKDVLQGGLKAGYYFNSAPSFGIELEGNYSKPKMKRQNVTITNPDFSYTDLESNYLTEDQLPAKVQLLQFNLNGLYRYQGFKDFTPYIGGGPSLNIIKITGTGYSGVIVAPFTDDSTCYSASNSDAPVCSNVRDTSVNIGANFKIGAEYHLDKDWGLGAEYHYNWVPVDIKHFRSANNLSADLEMQSVSLVLTRHF